MVSRAIRRFDAITPSEYLALATELAASSSAAYCRSAIDRAYYAAFLATRDGLISKGYISATQGSRVHRQVAEALLHITRDAGEMLVDLRYARNRLTYETGLLTLPRRQSLQSLLESARAVIETVQALPRNPP